MEQADFLQIVLANQVTGDGQAHRAQISGGATRHEQQMFQHVNGHN